VGSANFYYSPLVEQGSQDTVLTVGIFSSVSVSYLSSLVTTVMLTQQQELCEQSNTGNLCFGSGLDPDSIWSVDPDPGGQK
jgi:hypothetical protein